MGTSNRYKAAAVKARALTNKQLATELSALSPVSREKIQDLLPRKRDKELFIQLMEQVEAETEIDKKLAFLRENLQTAGKIAIKALGLLL